MGWYSDTMETQAVCDEIIKEGYLMRQKLVGDGTFEEYVVLQRDCLLVYKEKPDCNNDDNNNRRPKKTFPATAGLKLYVGEEERDDGTYYFYLKVALSSTNQCKFYTTSLMDRDDWFTQILLCVALKVYVHDDDDDDVSSAAASPELEQKSKNGLSSATPPTKGKSHSVSPVMFRRRITPNNSSPPKKIRDSMIHLPSIPSFDDLMDMYSKKYQRGNASKITQRTGKDANFNSTVVCN